MLVYELSGYKVRLQGAPEEPAWLLGLNTWLGCRQLHSEDAPQEKL